MAKDESEVGDDFAIDADVVAVGRGARLLADEGEAAECCVVLQEVLEGDADGSFMLCAEVGKLLEFGVIVLNRFVCGFDVKHAFSARMWLCYANYNVNLQKLQAKIVWGVDN